MRMISLQGAPARLAVDDRVPRLVHGDANHDEVHDTDVSHTIFRRSIGEFPVRAVVGDIALPSWSTATQNSDPTHETDVMLLLSGVDQDRSGPTVAIVSHRLSDAVHQAQKLDEVRAMELLPAVRKPWTASDRTKPVPLFVSTLPATSEAAQKLVDGHETELSPRRLIGSIETGVPQFVPS